MILCQCGREVKNIPNEVVVFSSDHTYKVKYPNRTEVQYVGGELAYSCCPHGDHVAIPKDLYDWGRILIGMSVHGETNHNLVMGAAEVRCTQCGDSLHMKEKDTSFMPLYGDLVDYNRERGYYTQLLSTSARPPLRSCRKDPKVLREKRNERLDRFVTTTFEKGPEEFRRVIDRILSEEKVAVLDEVYECRYDCKAGRLAAALFNTKPFIVFRTVSAF